MRKGLTLNRRVVEMAEQLMEARGISDFSELVAILIREDYERRYGPMRIEAQSMASAMVMNEPAAAPAGAGNAGTVQNAKGQLLRGAVAKVTAKGGAGKAAPPPLKAHE